MFCPANCSGRGICRHGVVNGCECHDPNDTSLICESSPIIPPVKSPSATLAPEIESTQATPQATVAPEEVSWDTIVDTVDTLSDSYEGSSNNLNDVVDIIINDIVDASPLIEDTLTTETIPTPADFPYDMTQPPAPIPPASAIESEQVNTSSTNSATLNWLTPCFIIIGMVRYN